MSEAKLESPRFGSVEAFDAWYEGQEGRWELHDGKAVAMSPERVAHALLKAQTWDALRRALRHSGSTCQAIPDGPMVPGPGLRRFQPDVLVVCERVGGRDILVKEPVILVEVLSPSTQHIDVSLKLESYFELPSVHHYLVVSSTRQAVMHYGRTDGPNLLTRLHRLGPIDLAPPGISITVEEIYEGLVLED